jgi:hypothetical protein
MSQGGHIWRRQRHTSVTIARRLYSPHSEGFSTSSADITTQQHYRSFNRIKYARGQLINAQTDFNKWLLTQLPMNLFYHPVQILGSNANSAGPVLVPTYVQPTP